MKYAIIAAALFALFALLAGCARSGSAPAFGARPNGNASSSAASSASGSTPSVSGSAPSKPGSTPSASGTMPSAPVVSPSLPGSSPSASATQSPQTNQDSSGNAPAPGSTQPPDGADATGSVLLESGLQEIVDAPATFSATSNAQMQNVIAGISVGYRLSELFNIDAALTRYNAMPPYSVQSSEFITNNRLNVEKLHTQVLANSKAFMERWTGGSRFTEFSSSDFEIIFNYVAEALQSSLDHGDLDTNLLDAKLVDLCLLRTTDAFYGQFNVARNTLVLNLTTLEVGQRNNPDVDLLKATAIHETMHLIQALPLEARNRRGFDENFGIGYKWDDLGINSLFATWFYEGAADMLMMEIYGEGSSPTSYAAYIPVLNLMTLSTILREDVGPTTVLRLSLQNDLSKLFDLFDCNTQEKQNELLKMMFAFEVTSPGNNEFSRLPEMREMDGAEQYRYRTGLRASIGQTLAKSFYSNLAARISLQQTKMEEIFTVISIYETGLANLTGYFSSERAGQNMEFFKNYMKMQNEFFSLLATDSGIDPGRLAEAYNAYHSALSANAVRLTFPGGEDSAYFRKIAAEMQGNKTITIKAAFDAFS